MKGLNVISRPPMIPAEKKIRIVLAVLAGEVSIAEHLGGHVAYTPGSIAVTLDRPDTPRIARALELLIDELNTDPAHLPGDRRPLTYQIATAQISTTTTPLLPEV